MSAGSIGSLGSLGSAANLATARKQYASKKLMKPKDVSVNGATGGTVGNAEKRGNSKPKTNLLS